MPQLQLPFFPAGLTPITNEIAFQCAAGRVCYFSGHLPVFQHEKKDLKSFRLFTSQLIVNKTARQADIAEAFQVPLATVKRYLKVYRERGPAGFYEQPRRRSASVLKGEVHQRAQELLEEGKSVPEVAQEVKVLPNTLHKAIRAGRLHAVKKNADGGGGSAQQQERAQRGRQRGADGLCGHPVAGARGGSAGGAGAGADRLRGGAGYSAGGRVAGRAGAAGGGTARAQ